MKLQPIAQISAAGIGGHDTENFLFDSSVQAPLTKGCFYGVIESSVVGMIQQDLPPLSEKSYDSRAGRIIDWLVEANRQSLEAVISRFDPKRIGVVLGTSNSGIMAAEDAFSEREKTGKFPSAYNYSQQEIGSLSTYLRKLLNLQGPAYTVSTACTSGAKAVASARRLIESGICDLVLTGGVDAFCKLTLAGFSSLELVSESVSKPFSKNRNGLNLGEAGALFLVARNLDSPFILAGAGEFGDAYHISSPDPEARGAISSINQALIEAGEKTINVGYLNLHGTGTILNDSMESIAVNSALGKKLPCSSTKPLTGHTLGAAGAIELAFCCKALETGRLPVHRFDGVFDDNLPEINLISSSEKIDTGKLVLSTSFAFGGSNCCLAIRLE